MIVGRSRVVLVRHDHVPAVHAELAPVGDRVARLELVLRVGQQVAGAAAVDADDGGGSSHGFDRSRGLPRPKSRPRCAAAHHTEPMRVVAGTVRGRRLAGPTGDGLRPTGDRVRESIFNSLFSRGAVDGAVVLDLFAGTGALGIEALSRGAQRAVFVESSPVSAQLVRDNLATCGMTDRAEVVVADGPTWLGSDRTPWDLVLLDPPYGFADWSDLLGGGLARRLSDRLAGMVVLESDREIDPGPGWHVESVRSHGTTVVMLMTPETDPNDPTDRHLTGSHCP